LVEKHGGCFTALMEKLVTDDEDSRAIASLIKEGMI
jgi:hypothetical protein